MSIYSPYFYIIRHKPSGMFYAGCQYHKKCKSSQLLKPDGYLTSSGTIHKLIDKDGLDSFEIVEIIEEKEILIPFGWANVHDFETSFLIENDCAKSDIWINMHNNSLLGHQNPKFRKLMLLKHGVEHCTQIPRIVKQCVTTRQQKLKEKTENSHYVKLILKFPKWIFNKLSKPSNWKWLPEKELKILYDDVMNEMNKPENKRLIHLSDKERKIILVSEGHKRAKDQTNNTRNKSLDYMKNRNCVVEIMSFPDWFRKNKLTKNWVWFSDDILYNILDNMKKEWALNQTENIYFNSLSDVERRKYKSKKNKVFLSSRESVTHIRSLAKSKNVKLKNGWWQSTEEQLKCILSELNHTDCI